MPQRVCAATAPAAQVGLVHDVVVVERGEVGQLDDAGRGDDLVGVGVVAHLGGQQHQQRPEPLAAGVHQVAGRLGHERGTAAHVPGQRLLDLAEPLAQPRGERVVADGECESGRILTSPEELSRMVGQSEHRAGYDAQDDRRGEADARWSPRSAATAG